MSGGAVALASRILVACHGVTQARSTVCVVRVVLVKLVCVGTTLNSIHRMKKCVCVCACARVCVIICMFLPLCVSAYIQVL